MSAEHDKLKEILAHAAALATPQGRASYLAAVCGDDTGLRAEVEGLLQAHDQAGDFLEQSVIPPLEEAMGEGPGSVIGRYKLLEEIGEGGFGRVFMAEQTEPVRRKVALKIIKAGMDTREVIARFEAERQALALMDHPNIAKVLDAGATDSGRPYFVMELVKGIPITNYCDRAKLPMEARLRLFMKLCHAVQHAHQKAIIHRDLKPSNILVTVVDGEPVPRIIDFGVAKALGQQLTERTLFTAFQQVIGTPAYMSPEQAGLSGADVDTRSDIYSLGVLLYELLTGVTPLDTASLRQAALDEIRRMIRETEPPKPSTRLRTMGPQLNLVAQHRHTEPSALSRSVHGDLDWIVMKALEKDRGRRYETVGALEQDLRHHLASEPVSAGPPGMPYRTRKFIRRHRLATFVTATIVVAAALSMAALSFGLFQAKQERDRAVAAEARAESEAAVSAAVNRFLLDDLLGQASPYAQPDREVKLRPLVDQAAGKVGDRFAAQPEVELQIRQTLARVYQALGELGKARIQMDRVKELTAEQELPADHPRRWRLGNEDADLLIEEGKPAEARKIIEEILAVQQRVLDPEHEQTLLTKYSLANACARAGQTEEARKIYEELVPQMQRLHGSEHRRTLMARNNLACVYLRLGMPEEARRAYTEILPLLEKVVGPEHPVTLMARNNLANSYRDAGNAEEALRMYEALLKVQQKVLGGGHPETLRTLGAIAHAYIQLRKPEEARKRYDEILRLQPETLGPRHRATLTTWGDLANAYTDLDQPDEARKIYEEIVPLMEEALGKDDLVTLISKVNLAFSYQQLGRLDDARAHYEKLLPVLRKALGPDAPVTLHAANNLADIKKIQHESGDSPESPEP